MRNVFKNCLKTGIIIPSTIIIVLLLFGIANAQWNATGPEGGEIDGLTVDGSNIYAGTLAGAYRSTDNGMSWTKICNGLNNIHVTVFMVNGIYLFAGTTGGGVYRSTDNGSTWTEVSNGLPPDTRVTCFAKIGTTIFMGAGVQPTSEGVYRSTDNGDSWTSVNNGITNLYIRALTTHDTIIFAGTSGAKVFRSTDLGNSWVQAGTGISQNVIYALAVSDTNIFAATNNGGPYLSTDNGDSWTLINNGLPATRNIHDFAISGPYLFAGAQQGVYLTSDNGTNWTSINGPGLTSTKIQKIAVNDTNLFAGSDLAGIFYTGNLGASWSQVNNGIDGLFAHDFASIGSNLFVATQAGVFRSTDNGLTWDAVNNGLTVTNIYALASNGTDLFAGTGLGGGVFKSTDNGTSWTLSGLAGYFLHTVSVIDSVIYAGSMLYPNGAYRSTDNGATWSPIGLDGLWVWDFKANNNYLFAATWSGVFRSTDQGSSWEAADSGLTDTKIARLAIMPGYIFAATGEELGGEGASGVFRSSDNGTSWTSVSTGLPDQAVCWSFAVKDTGLFVSTSSGIAGPGVMGDRVYLTTNNGENWIPVSDGLISGYVENLFIYGENIYAATLGQSVWWRPLSEVILPAELTAFTGNLQSDGSVLLNWSTATETNNRGFNIERGQRSEAGSQNWEKVGFVAGNGTTSQPESYSFTDKNATSGTYSYRLKQIDFNGTYSYSKMIEVNVNVPLKFSLSQNYPNPFNPTTKIKYSIPQSEFVTLKVFDILGREVASLVNEQKEAGSYEVTFNGSDLGSGVYFYQLHTAHNTLSHKMLLLK